MACIIISSAFSLELLLVHRIVLLTLLEHVHVGLARVDLTGVRLQALDKIEVEVLAWVGLLLREVTLF